MFLLWLGVFLAFMAPAGLSIITTTLLAGPVGNRALLVYAGTAAGGFSVGLVIGGLLTVIDWRWVFFAPVVPAAVILFATLRLLPAEERRKRSLAGFDLLGAVCVTGAMLLVVCWGGAVRGCVRRLPIPQRGVRLPVDDRRVRHPGQRGIEEGECRRTGLGSRKGQVAAAAVRTPRTCRPGAARHLLAVDHHGGQYLRLVRLQLGGG